MNTSDHNAGQSARARWSKHLARWERSGQTQRAYCEANGLSLSSLRGWRHRLARERQPAMAANFIPLQLGVATAVSPAGAPSRLEVSLASGVQIRLEGALAEQALERLLKVIR